MNEWALLGIGVVLTVGTGLFVASEFALVNLDRHDLEKRQAAGEKRLGPTIGALRITSTHLSSAQLGITLTTLLTGYTFEPAVSSLLEEPLSGAGVPDGAVVGIGSDGRAARRQKQQRRADEARGGNHVLVLFLVNCCTARRTAT